MTRKSTSRRKNAIVTGAASGLGRAISVRLARDGWFIAAADVNDAGSEETIRLVKAAGGDGSVEHLDVRSIEEWESLRDRLIARWDHLDLLVNNAGVAGSGHVGEYPIENWRWILDVNLWSGINGCHTMVEWLKSNPEGSHIINTCSMAAIVSAPRMAAYNVTKAGMLALSETLYGELMPHGVGVTAVCPSFFRTNLLEKARWCSEQERDRFERAFVEARMTADDVAEAAVTAMHRKKLYVIVPRESKIHWMMKRAAPVLLLKRIAALFASGAEGPQAASRGSAALQASEKVLSQSR